MSNTWPPSLPQSPLLNGCVRMRDNSFISTSVRQGKTRRRRITSQPIKRYNVTIGPLDETQQALFDSWYDDDLNGGVDEFDWKDPLLRTPATCRFGDGAPQMVPVTNGGANSQTEIHCTFILEVLT